MKKAVCFIVLSSFAIFLHGGGPSSILSQGKEVCKDVWMEAIAMGIHLDENLSNTFTYNSGQISSCPSASPLPGFNCCDQMLESALQKKSIEEVNYSVRAYLKIWPTESQKLIELVTKWLQKAWKQAGDNFVFEACRHLLHDDASHAACVHHSESIQHRSAVHFDDFLGGRMEGAGRTEAEETGEQTLAKWILSINRNDMTFQEEQKYVAAQYQDVTNLFDGV
ncbi:hypothetical protein SprV_0702431500 [Sparganum proliferum]